MENTNGFPNKENENEIHIKKDCFLSMIGTSYFKWKIISYKNSTGSNETFIQVRLSSTLVCKGVESEKINEAAYRGCLLRCIYKVHIYVYVVYESL